jgi:hypothetical protein
MLNVEPRQGPRPKEVSTPVEVSRRVAGSERASAGADKAWASAQKQSGEAGRRKDFLGAVAQLRNTNVSMARDLISAQGLLGQELYILAEQVTQNREAVLRGYPKPSARAVERYGAFADEFAAAGALRADGE